MSKRNLKNCLILITLISFVSNTCFAQEPSNKGLFLQVDQGTQVPFSGWCFNDVAAAKLIASIEYGEKRCLLRIEQKLETQSAENELIVNNLKLRTDTLQKEYDDIINIKNEQIKSLEEAASKRPNSYLHWAAIAGMVAGGLVTLAVLHIDD